MEKLALENYGVDTLNFEEMLCIDGGTFWETVGIIVGVAVVVAAVIVTGGLAAAVLL